MSAAHNLLGQAVREESWVKAREVFYALDAMVQGDEPIFAARGNAAPATGEEEPPKCWLLIQEKRCVTCRKGPFQFDGMKRFIREAMEAKPYALLTVLSMGHDGPQADHAGEWLTIADMRSRSRVQRHNASSAHDFDEIATFAASRMGQLEAGA